MLTPRLILNVSRKESSRICLLSFPLTLPLILTRPNTGPGLLSSFGLNKKYLVKVTHPWRSWQPKEEARIEVHKACRCCTTAGKNQEAILDFWRTCGNGRGEETEKVSGSSGKEWLRRKVKRSTDLFQLVKINQSTYEKGNQPTRETNEQTFNQLTANRPLNQHTSQLINHKSTYKPSNQPLHQPIYQPMYATE